MDRPEEHATSSTIGRRDLLRRGAALGAAMAVATPAVQALGRVSAFAQTSPPPTEEPPPPPPADITGISYIGLVFTCNGTTYRAKWEEGAGDNGWADVGGNNLPQCPEPAGWSTATVYPHHTNIAVDKQYVDGELYRVTFTLPAGCTASTGVAKGGNPQNPSSGGYCVPGVAGADPRIITFTAG